LNVLFWLEKKYPLNLRARIFWIFFYYLVRPMYTSAWKIRSRNNSLEREWPKRNKERERRRKRSFEHTHFLVIYADLLELIWILDKSILRRLKSRIDWNLECGIFEKRDDVTEQNQLENQQIWNTNKPWTRKSWTRKSWTTNVSASFF